MNSENVSNEAEKPALNKGAVSSSLLSDLKEIETLYVKLDAAYKKINPESTMMDFERGCYEMVKNIIARMEASNDC